MSNRQELHRKIKEVIVESLNLEGVSAESIGDDQPLFGEGLELDSVDALEMVVGLEQAFGIRIEGQKIEPEKFGTVARLAELVEELSGRS